jgi:hypothetical protein
VYQLLNRRWMKGLLVRRMQVLMPRFAR